MFEPLLVCVFVILLHSLASRLSLEILLPMILSLLYFHRCDFTCSWKRWSPRPRWNLGNNLFLGRLTCWSLQWARLCQFLSAWSFPIPLYYVLGLRSRRPCCTWMACEDAPSLKALSLILLVDQLFLHLERLSWCAVAHCEMWLTSIGSRANHLGVACFLDLTHGADSVLLEVTVIAIVEEPFLANKWYWLVTRLLFNQLGNLWLMGHDVGELPSSERLVCGILKSLVTSSFVGPKALCLCRLVTQLVFTTQHVLVHVQIEASLFYGYRRLELLCFLVRSYQLILPVLLVDNFGISCSNLLYALMASLQEFALGRGDLRNLAQLVSGPELIVWNHRELRILIGVFLPLFTIAATRTTFCHGTILEIAGLMHLCDVSLIFWIEIQIVIFNFAMLQCFNQASVIQRIGLWAAPLICLLGV